MPLSYILPSGKRTFFECHPHTVRATLRRWEDRGLGGLWAAVGRGAKPKWQAADLESLLACLEHAPRTDNSLP